MIVLKTLTLLLLILLPLGELLRFNVGNSIYIKPLDITAGLLALSFIIWLTYTKKIRGSFNWGLLLFPLVGLASLLVNSSWLQNTQLFVALLYLVRWVSYLSILFIIPFFEDTFKKKLFSLLLFDGLVVVFFGFLQYFFYSDIRSLVSIGWDDHMYRLFSTFYDPNFAGAFLVLYLFFASGFLYKAITSKDMKKLYIFGSIIGLTILAILLTFSRSALLMLFFGGSLLLILLKQKKIILGGIALIILYFIVVSPRFYIENTNLFRAASTGARLGSYNNAITIYQNSPILGVGFNTYRYAQQEYGFRKEVPKYPSNADAGVDNSFLFVLATTGIIGFAAFLIMWANILRNVVVYFRKRHDIWAAIFIASACGLFVNAFFINSLFFPAIVLWMWVFYSLVKIEK